MPGSVYADLDLDRLMRLRLVVGRFGEMDGAKWWNTNGVLGRQGASLLGRGLPRTHRFARARLVFTVARARSREVFDPPGSVTLWSLPAALEDDFDARYAHWLARDEEWQPFFAKLEALASSDLIEALRRFELLGDEDARSVGSLRRSAENRAVLVDGAFADPDTTLTRLAAAFSRGEPGRPAIPYVKLAS